MACPRADTNPTLQVTCCQGPSSETRQEAQAYSCVPVVQCKLCHLALTQIFKPFMCYPWTPKWSQSRADPGASILQLHLWLGLGAQLAGPLLLSVCSHGDPVGVNQRWVWSPASRSVSRAR